MGTAAQTNVNAPGRARRKTPNWLEHQLAEWAKAPVDIAALFTHQRTSYEAAWERFSQQYPRQVKVMQKRIQQVAKAAQQRVAVRSEATRGITVVRAFALRAGELLGITLRWKTASRD
jgi:pyruvate,water dikinase